MGVKTMNYDEMRALCAEAMEVPLEGYDPHKDGGQLVALIKKLHIETRPSFANGKHVVWQAIAFGSDDEAEYEIYAAYHLDLNKAVVMCAAKVLRAAKIAARATT
jgi:hypothetical protein